MDQPAGIFAWMFAWTEALGPALGLGGVAVYPPWSIILWRLRYGEEQAGTVSGLGGLYKARRARLRLYCR